MRFLRTGIWLLLIAVVFMAGNAVAQNVVFSAQADRDKMGLQDQIQVTYTIHDVDGLESLSPASTADFTVVAGPFDQQSTSMSVVNGHMQQSASLSRTLVLQPRRTGSLTIPAAIAKTRDGKAFKSNAIPITVVSGQVASAQPSRQQRDPFGGYDPFANDPFFADPFGNNSPFQNPFASGGRSAPSAQSLMQPQVVKPEDVKKNLFLRVVVDKPKAYVGEQITASYKMYGRIPASGNVTKMPMLSGFWAQDFDVPMPAKPVDESVNGQWFQSALLKKTALFPQQSGTLTLDPTEMDAQVDVVKNDPQGNGYYDKMQVTLRSQPVQITVLPLPEAGKPAHFSGAVGKFKIDSKLDRSTISSDGSAVLTVTITGAGNLKLMEAPRIVLPNGLEADDPQSTEAITGKTNTIEGTRTFKYILSADHPGNYNVQGIAFSYFDPKQEHYITLRTPGFSLKVEEGTSGEEDVPQPLAAAKPKESNKEPVIIATIMVMALSGLFFLFFPFWKKRKKKKPVAATEATLQPKVATPVVPVVPAMPKPAPVAATPLNKLAAAQEALNADNASGFYRELLKALKKDLAARMAAPEEAVNPESIKTFLNKREVSVITQERLQKLLTDSEMALYAFSTSDSGALQNTYVEAVAVLAELDRSLQPGATA